MRFTKARVMKRKRRYSEMSADGESTAVERKRKKGTTASISIPNYDSDSDSDDEATLSDHIKRFETDGMIRAFVDEKLLTRWRKTLKTIFLQKITPAIATKLVILVLEKVSAVVSAARVEGFCRCYGFPANWTKDLERNENRKIFAASSSLNDPDSFEGSTYYLATLSFHVKRFERDRKIMDKLASCFISEKLLTKWCNTLGKICSKALTSATVAKLVLLLLEKVSHAVATYELVGFCRAYWLPVYWTIDLSWKTSSASSIMKVSASTYYSAIVSEHIMRSETQPKILDEPGVDTRDCGEDLTMSLWCKQLEMMFSEAMTPAAATRLVLSVMNDVSRVVSADDLEVFCRLYQLPASWTMDVARNERIHNERKSGRTSYIIEEYYGDPTYDAATLSDHIKRFKTDPKIIFELASCGNERALTNWRKTTKRLCTKGLTCAAAVRLVLIVLEKVSSVLYSDDLEGFCRHYHLSANWRLDVALIESRTGSAPSIMRKTDYDEELLHQIVDGLWVWNQRLLEN